MRSLRALLANVAQTLAAVGRGAGSAPDRSARVVHHRPPARFRPCCLPAFDRDAIHELQGNMPARHQCASAVLIIKFVAQDRVRQRRVRQLPREPPEGDWPRELCRETKNIEL